MTIKEGLQASSWPIPYGCTYSVPGSPFPVHEVGKTAVEAGTPQGPHADGWQLAVASQPHDCMVCASDCE